MSDQDYYALNPDTVLSAVESTGLQLDGSLLALNSYENRVYRLADFDGTHWVVKFYRPGRWTDAQIIEEHEFAQELSDFEIPVIAPQAFNGDETLFHWQSFRFAIFPCHGGREPNLEDPEHLTQLGRYLGRIHQVGASKAFAHRPALTVKAYGHESVATILNCDYLPDSLRPAYEAVATQVMTLVDECFANHYQKQWAIRLHADFHPGNILWGLNGPHLVDLDDARSGPAIQDLWMLIGSDPEHQCARLDDILQGYEEFSELPFSQFHLIESLRALRMLHYCAWLVRRWQDPSFQHHFPWFAEIKYWEQQILLLKEQLATMHEDTTFERLSSYF